MLDGVLTNTQKKYSLPPGLHYGNSKALVIGNGESRSWFKPCHQTILDKSVVTWGCNAIYRDGGVDNLVAVDYAMQQEIYDSGYEGKCHFANWTPIPTDAAQMMFMGYDIPDDFIHYSKDKTGSCVVSGKDPATIHEKVELTIKLHPDLDFVDIKNKMEKDLGVWITYVRENDNVENIVEPRGWSAGNTALHLACQHGAEKVYILGFDLSSYDAPINNIYKGTNNYLPADSRGFNSMNWESQMDTTMSDFPDVEFIVVGKDITISQLCEELMIV